MYTFCLYVLLTSSPPASPPGRRATDSATLPELNAARSLLPFRLLSATVNVRLIGRRSSRGPLRRNFSLLRDRKNQRSMEEFWVYIGRLRPLPFGSPVFSFKSSFRERPLQFFQKFSESYEIFGKFYGRKRRTLRPSLNFSQKKKLGEPNFNM